MVKIPYRKRSRMVVTIALLLLFAVLVLLLEFRKYLMLSAFR